MCGNCLPSVALRASPVETCPHNIHSNMVALQTLWGPGAFNRFKSTPAGNAKYIEILQLKPEAFQDLARSMRNATMVLVLRERLSPDIVLLCEM
jgi:hypothetical protein